MSFLDKLFGKKSDDTTQSTRILSYTPKDPREDPDMMRIFDGYGQELFIAKDEWRKNVLPANLRSNWSNADALYGMIVDALNNGFAADVLAASKQFYAIDHGSVRSTCLYAINLRETEHLDEAGQVLRSYLEQNGENGIILTNLAKVYSAKDQDQLAEATLWHALKIDPNQESGFAWNDAIHRERGGEEAALEAMRRVAALPGSWRAQLWLARVPLESGNIDRALKLYRNALAHAPQPVPAELLMHMSGDLGNKGLLTELIQLTKPYYSAQEHGLDSGNNLIKAYLDLGQTEAAHEIVEQLYAFERPDWKEHLSYWDTEIAKARIKGAPADMSAPLQMTMLSIQGPVWLAPDSPFAPLFGAKQQGTAVIRFLGSSAEVASSPGHAERQLTDWPGRLSRALPLFLAEQVELGTEAQGRTMVPWLVGGNSGFVLSGAAWSDEQAIGDRQGEDAGDYAVRTHLKCQAEPWSIELRLIRTADGACLGQFAEHIDRNGPGDAAFKVAQALIALLHREAGISLRPHPSLYQIPTGPHLSDYLQRLEQLLAVRCAAMKECNPEFLYGEREILDGNLHLCLSLPSSVVTRVLLTQTLTAMKKVRHGTIAEFKERIILLQTEHPLPGPVHTSVQQSLNAVFAT